MEFKSTLKRAKERYDLNLKQAEATGYKEPPEIVKVFNLVKDSASFGKARIRSLQISQDMQPSITGEDLKIASDLQLANVLACVLNLSREGLITLKK